MCEMQTLIRKLNGVLLCARCKPKSDLNTLHGRRIIISFMRLLSETISGIFFLFFILSMNLPYIVIVLMQQKPGQIFKVKIEDWDTTIVPAIQNNRVLLLKNVNTGLHSDELSETLSRHMKMKCEVRITPPVSFSYKTTTALVKVPSHKKAQEFLQNLESNFVMVANRLVTATIFSYDEFKGPQILKYPGHLDFLQVRDYQMEDYKNAVATSHLAQGNTIEFVYGLPWRVLDEQHEDQWKMLQEAQTVKPKVGDKRPGDIIGGNQKGAVKRRFV